MSSLAISCADQFTGQYASEAVMIEAMLGRVMIAGKQMGWTGFRLDHFSWDDEPGADALIQAPLACLALAPGSQPTITVEQCRTRLREQAQAEKKRAYLAGGLFAHAADKGRGT